MALRDKILILGPSGSGKSSLLRELAQQRPEFMTRLQDLDELILRSHTFSELPVLIEELGWEKFRQLERSILLKWLAAEGGGVLALGGGAMDQELMSRLKQTDVVKLCCLFSDFETCWSRLVNDRSHPRPLLMLGKERFEAIFRERESIFLEVPWRMANGADGDLRRLAESFWEQVLSS